MHTELRKQRKEAKKGSIFYTNGYWQSPRLNYWISYYKGHFTKDLRTYKELQSVYCDVLVHTRISLHEHIKRGDVAVVPFIRATMQKTQTCIIALDTIINELKAKKGN